MIGRLALSILPNHRAIQMNKPLKAWQMILLTYGIYLPIVAVFAAGGWTLIFLRYLWRKIRF